jgi:tetratricopeptide (TPR) repeat protein
VLETQTADGTAPAGENNTVLICVPGYALGELLGRGGMGDVFRARDLEMDRDVAVKILKDRYAPDSSTARRFVEEAKITGQLQHPGIPAVYRVSQLSDGRPFLAMKLIKGQTLDELLKQNATINSLAIIESIAQALGYAHAHGVIHRDIKPANVMVGPFGEVQLMDWGLAKLVQNVPSPSVETDDPDATTAPTEIRSGRDSSYSQAGSILGTPAYMPPEQAGGETDRVGPASDVFGLGALWCKLLTGQAPFSGESAESVRRNAMRGKMEDALLKLSECRAEPGVVALVQQCLSFEPAERPADGNAVAKQVAELRIAAEERAKQAELSRVRAEVETREQRKRRRVLILAGSSMVAVLLAGLGISFWQMLRANDAEAEARANAIAANAERDAKEEQRRLAVANEELANRERDAKEEQRKMAEASQKRAQASERNAINFRNQAVNALRVTLGTEVEQLLGSRTTFTDAERRFLLAVVNQWNKFAKMQARDVTTRMLEAEGHYRVGVIYFKLGYLDDAERGLRMSIDLYGTLVGEFPNDKYLQKELAQSHSELALLHAKRWERIPAKAEHARAIAIHEKLLAKFPNEPVYAYALAREHNNLGTVLTDSGEYDDARAHFLTAIKLLKAHPNQNLKEHRYDLLLANLQNNFGLSHVLERNFSPARDSYQSAVAIYDRLLESKPAEAEVLLPVVITHLNLGGVLEKLDDRTAAKTAYDRAFAVVGKLVRDFPVIPDYRHQLARAHQSLGVHADRGGDRNAARQHFRDGSVLVERLVAEYPAVGDYRVSFGNIQLSIGDSHRVAGEYGPAAEYYERALATVRPVYDKDGREPDARRVLRECYENRAELLRRTGKPAVALADWDRALPLASGTDRPFTVLGRAVALAQAGQKEKALAEITPYLQSKDREQLLSIARVFALAANDGGSQAVETLQKALAAGWKDRSILATDSDFEAIRGREDFRKLQAETGK